MAPHEKFRFKSLDELRAKVEELDVDVRFDDDVTALGRPVEAGSLRIPNSMGIHPMEGFDSEADGAPGELAFRRYERYARGGAGVIWFEAVAVTPEGRSNPRQLWLHERNVDAFARLVDRVREAAADEFGPDHRPVTVVQLTHSGRFSRPRAVPEPVIVVRHPLLDAVQKLPDDFPVVTDDRLRELEDAFVEAAGLARRAGFDAVDIKACHGYLIPELLTARGRPGPFGGKFEDRARFLLDVVVRVANDVAGLEVAVRLNASDAIPYPYGWGVDAEDPAREDPAEPLLLARELVRHGVRLLSITEGIPNLSPHRTRPFDVANPGATQPPEHPLEGVARLFAASRAFQRALPEVAVMGAGYTWLRQFGANAGAANVRNGWTRIMGVGRGAFAYPDFARDVLREGRLDHRKVCTTCSRCSQLIRGYGPAGCVVRDPRYLPIYRQYCGEPTN